MTSWPLNSRKEETRLQSHLNEADIKIEKLNREIAEFHRKIGSRPMSIEMEKTPTPLDRLRSDTPKILPPRKDTPKKRDTARASSAVESLHEYDAHLSAISKCDDKIARFEDNLKQMRTDLYGSIEAITEKINVTAASVDPPQKEGGSENY